MTGMPRPMADTNPVGRHGRIGVDILPHDFVVPTFEQETSAPRPVLAEELGVVTMGAIEQQEVSKTGLPTPHVERPDEAPGLYL